MPGMRCAFWSCPRVRRMSFRERANTVVGQAAAVGSQPSDTPDERLRKSALVLSSLLITFLTFIWVGTYAALGLWRSALIPFAYQVASLVGLVFFARTKRYAAYRASQVAMFLFSRSSSNGVWGDLWSRAPSRSGPSSRPSARSCSMGPARRSPGSAPSSRSSLSPRPSMAFSGALEGHSLLRRRGVLRAEHLRPLGHDIRPPGAFRPLPRPGAPASGRGAGAVGGPASEHLPAGYRGAVEGLAWRHRGAQRGSLRPVRRHHGLHSHRGTTPGGGGRSDAGRDLLGLRRSGGPTVSRRSRRSATATWSPPGSQRHGRTTRRRPPAWRSP